jgi:hypothetical protein
MGRKCLFYKLEPEENTTSVPNAIIDGNSFRIYKMI